MNSARQAATHVVVEGSEVVSLLEVVHRPSERLGQVRVRETSLGISERTVDVDGRASELRPQSGGRSDASERGSSDAEADLRGSGHRSSHGRGRIGRASARRVGSTQTGRGGDLGRSTGERDGLGVEARGRSARDGTVARRRGRRAELRPLRRRGSESTDLLGGIDVDDWIAKDIKRKLSQLLVF